MQKGRDAIKDVLDEPKSSEEPQNKPGWLF
jgi:hypothetical protein